MTFEQFNNDIPFDLIKERVIYAVINRERNQELLTQVPSVDYLDLSIIFYYMADDDRTTYMITNEYLRKNQITVEELMNLASENTQRILGLYIDGIVSTIADLLDANELKELIATEDSMMPLYVLSNKRQYNGAAAILYKNLLYALSAKLKSDLYIIPCSVHEMILLKPIKGCQLDTDSLKEMISVVNDTELSESDVLSYNLYYYSRDKDELSIA